MAWGLVYAPGRHDCAEELEAADVHASRLHTAFHEPDAEAVRGEIGGGEKEKDLAPMIPTGRLGAGNAMSSTIRPRTAHGVVELAPFFAVEGL